MTTGAIRAIPPLPGAAVRLRLSTMADAPRFAEILGQPEVAAWWGAFDEDRVRREVIAHEGEVSFAIEVGGQAAAQARSEEGGQIIGLIEFTEENQPDYRHAGMDIALDPHWHHQGLGADALRTLARYLFTRRGHHRITIDPAAANERAIRCYRRVGFRPVGIMRRYERGPDGIWHDGLLMDLLSGELTDPEGEVLSVPNGQ